MAVWRTSSVVKEHVQARKEAQKKYFREQAAGLTDKGLTPGHDIHKVLAERTPEQTALIALRGLLEAKEIDIQRLEVCFSPASNSGLIVAHIAEIPYVDVTLQAEAKGAQIRSEQQTNALRQTCHDKIQGIQKANAAQLQALKVQLCHSFVRP